MRWVVGDGCLRTGSDMGGVSAGEGAEGEASRMKGGNAGGGEGLWGRECAQK
jgi:hypothetical protein